MRASVSSVSPSERIPYVYRREFEARTAHRRATCTCSAGGPNDRTVSCSLHNKSAGFSKQRTAPAPHEESGGLGFRLDAVETAANEAIAFEAIALVNTGMYEEALPALTQWISQEPSNTEALAQRSLCYGALRWYSRGLVDARSTVCRLKPTDANSWLRVADLYYGMRQYDQARKAYLVAGRFTP